MWVDQVTKAAPREYRLTPLSKAISAFAWYADDDGIGGRFKTEEFRSGLGKELKILHIRVQILYLITALLAFILIGGGVKGGDSISVMGNTIPVSGLSNSSISIINAGLFGYYCTTYMSYIVAISMLRQLNERPERLHWMFYIADIAGDMLWAATLRSGDHLFEESAAANFWVRLIMFTALSTLVLHVGIILWSCGITAGSAWGISWLNFSIATFSGLVVAAAAFALFFGTTIQLRYKVKA